MAALVVLSWWLFNTPRAAASVECCPGDVAGCAFTKNGGSPIRIHYMNCGTMRPRGAGLVVPDLALTPSLCLLIEDADRLILVDTGLGTRDMEDPRRLGFSNALLNAQVQPGVTALHRIEVLGLEPGRVTDIICTHLDRDHAGGLSDFPQARVHVLKAEHDAALGPGLKDRRESYRECHFEHGPAWVLHEKTSPVDWFGLECIRDLPGLPPEIVLVPLPGHTRGHCGVALKTPEGGLFHCGDAYYVRSELERPPAGVSVFRRIAHQYPEQARLQVERIRELLERSGGEVAPVVAHDRRECERLTGERVTPDGRGVFEKEIKSSIEIAAGAGLVWEVLAGFDRYPEWNPMITRAAGVLRTGARLDLEFAAASGKVKRFRPVLLVVDEGRELRWLGQPGVPGFLVSEHYFKIESLNDTCVRLDHNMVFHGLLTPVLFPRLEAATRSRFEDMNRALRDRAQGRRKS